MLPNQYVEISDLPLRYLTSQHYIDTGIYPSDQLEIDLLIRTSGTQGHIFGARNTNAQNSAGQLGIFSGGTTTNYFLYNAARVSVTSHFVFTDAHFYIKNNNSIWQSLNYIATAQGATGSFTGTRTMYVGGINNAGSILGGQTVVLGGLIIKDNGVKVLDLIPCYDTANSQIGVYDLVSESFIAVTPNEDVDTNYYLLNASQSTGGQGYFKNHHDELTKQMYGLSNSIIFGQTFKVKCVAMPDEGYKFHNWTDSNGNVLSEQQEFFYTPTSSGTIIANFQKVAKSKNLNGNFMAKVMPYDDGSEVVEPIYLTVRNATITNDALQKSTSTIVCNDVPSGVLPTQAVVLFSPKGQVNYVGIIQSVEGDTLTCREVLSVYDREYLVNTSVFSSDIFTVTRGIDELIEKAMDRPALFSSDQDSLLARRMFQFQPIKNVATDVKIERALSLFHENNQGSQMPAFTEFSTINLEDYFQNLFDQYGVYVDVLLSDDYIVPYPKYYKQNPGITLSDNYERVSDVNVVSETQEANVLLIYSTSGSLRGRYAVTTDGEVESYTTSDPSFVAFNEYKSKVVTSDDNVEMVITQNLSNSSLNHKITFNVDFGGLINFEDLKVGMPLDLYVGNKLYNSVITAMKYDITHNQVDSATITLGKVRTSLTSKLNRS